MSTNSNICTICLMSQVVEWREAPINETLRKYVDDYLQGVREWYPSLDSALSEWGQNINYEIFEGEDNA